MALTELITLQGKYGIASGGWGGAVATSGTISVSIPVGATVVKAYAYTSVIGLYCAGGLQALSNVVSTDYGEVTVDGDGVELTTIARYRPSVHDLVTRRGECTDTIAALVDGGPGGTYDIDVAEYVDTYVHDHYPTVFAVCTNFQDGIGLVIIYEHPDLPSDQIVAIYDGTQAGTNPLIDEFDVTLPATVHPNYAGYAFEIRMGIGFSCCGEKSSFALDGHGFANEAGNNDNSVDPTPADGGLFTLGGDFDDVSPFPDATYEDDHERYDATTTLTDPFDGFTFSSVHESGNDNIFLAVFLINPGEAPPDGVITLQSVELGAEGDSGTEARIVMPRAVAIAASGWVSTPTEIGRLRRFPHLSEEHQRIKVSMLELEYQRSVATALGETPQIRLRVSRDGGQTYGTPMFKDAGVLGLTNQRAKYNRLGQGRDYVFELFVQDAVFWSFEDCYLQADKGTS